MKQDDHAAAGPSCLVLKMVKLAGGAGTDLITDMIIAER